MNRLHRFLRSLDQSSYAQDGDCTHKRRQNLTDDGGITSEDQPTHKPPCNTKQNLNDQRKRKSLEDEIGEPAGYRTY